MSSMIQVFLSHEGEVLPAVIHEHNLQKFKSLGYKDTFAEASEDLKPKKDDNPDADDEKSQLIEAVNSLTDKDQIESFIKQHFSVDIDKRGSLETVKEKAISIIKSGE